MSALPAGVAALYPIDESGPLLRFHRPKRRRAPASEPPDEQHLPDLDDLLLWLASIDCYGDPRDWWDTGDCPTLLDWWWKVDRQVRVDWYRISPCTCGEHGWHVDYPHGLDPELGPTGPRPGVFLGVWE